EQARGINRGGLSPDGGLLAVSIFSPPGLPPAGTPRGIRLWDVPSKQPITPLPPLMEEGSYASVELSPDGRWLAAGWEQGVRIWSARRWDAPPRTLHGRTVSWGADHFAFSPDSRILAFSRTTTEIQLYDLETSEEIARLLAPDA